MNHMCFQGSYGQESCSCNEITNTWIEEYADDRSGSLCKLQHQAADFNGVYPEFVRNCRERTWWILFMNGLMFYRQLNCQNCSNGPRSRYSKTRQILFWSCALTTYFVAEWDVKVTWAADTPTHSASNWTPVHQAGLRKHRSCTEQVMALTTHIENGFHCQIKTGVVFVDQPASYDTEWRDYLCWSLWGPPPVRTFLIYSNRFKCSSEIRAADGVLNNGLPQGSYFLLWYYSTYTCQTYRLPLWICSSTLTISRRLDWDVRRPYSVN
jgi:hypothetical protein